MNIKSMNFRHVPIIFGKLFKLVNGFYCQPSTTSYMSKPFLVILVLGFVSDNYSCFNKNTSMTDIAVPCKMGRLR